MSEREQREESIFEAGVQLPASDRVAYLKVACGEDHPLRERIEALLQAHEGAGNFLEKSAAPAFQKTVLSAPLAEKSGDKIDHYKLLEQIGEGGCGVVYMAEQEEPMRRRVALKVVKLGMDTKQVIARFEAERQALALMDHPNIAKVLDAGATNTGRPYFVMELVRGLKITEYCDQNNLAAIERLQLFIQVCRAVQHAHQKGVIHRDIKPSNILITLHDGVPVPKVIDFGIAKATQGRLTDQTVFTAFQQFLGTPAYMSPEQAEMSGLDVDTRTDIYSLGVLLYELLTGGPPFDPKELVAAGLDAMRRTIREREPARPSTRLTQELVAAGPNRPKSSAASEPASEEERKTSARGLSQKKELITLLRGDVDWIVMKCLEKDRTRRYETANGLAMDIERHLSNEPIGARPPSRIYRLQKLARRNRGTLLMVSAGLVALLLTLVILAVSNVRITRERNQKIVALGNARTSEGQAREQLFLALRSQAQARRYSRKMGQRFESLAALAEAARIRPDSGLRDDAIAAMALSDIRRGPSWEGLPPDATAVAYDGLYKRYAFANDKGIISIRSIPGNQETQRFGSSSAYSARADGHGLLFSPDGNFLAKLEEESKLRIWRVSDGQSVLQDMPAKCWGLAFSLDSRQVAVGQKDWIICFDLASGQESNRWQARAKAYCIAFHPDNRRIAVGYFSSTDVSVYDTTDGTDLVDLPMGSSGEHVVAWHPDGRRLAVAGSEPRIQIWDVETKHRLATLEGHVQRVTALSFHPGGALLASGSWDGAVCVWDPASGRQLMRMPLQAWTKFSADGRWLGATQSDGKLQLLEVSSNPVYRTVVSSLGAGQDVYYAGDISADGELLAMSMDDGVRLLELETGRELAFLAIDYAESAFFQGDSHVLFTCSPEAGMQQWEIRTTETDLGKFSVGQPRKIEIPFVPDRAWESAGTHSIAVVGETSGKALVLNPAEYSSAGKIMTHPWACYVAISGDGRWLATSGWHSDRVRLWNAHSGNLVEEWVKDQPTLVFFTPDSENLIISRADDFGFWNVNTLQLTRRLRRDATPYPGYVAFSPDRKLMALEMAPGVIHLMDVATARIVARLEDPSGDRATWMAFSPTEPQLVVAARYESAIHIWDLRAMRAHLKTMGLDWDWPEFPPATSRSKVAASSTLLRP